jgi:hypothetical protein
MAARSIKDKMTFDEVEDEILFTRAALKADPDAEDLLPMTDDWMGMLDEPRRLSLAAREALADADGSRMVSNHRLDAVCTRFGDELFLDVGKDRTARRWVQHFSTTVSKFVRQALGKQVTSVKAWLGSSTDPVLERHRETLTLWSGRADDAIVATKGTALARGSAWVAREDLAEGLTAARDGLYETLAARARERGLDREWPGVFFRKTPASSSPAERRSSGNEGGGE